MTTPYVARIKPGGSAGTDCEYTSLSAWEAALGTVDLTVATTKVFGISSRTGTTTGTATGATSGATATLVQQTTPTQVLLASISGTFQNGETVNCSGGGSFVLSTAGDSASLVADCYPGSSEDTTLVTISGMVLNADKNMTIRTAAGYAHGGKWSTSAYILKGTSTHVLTLSTDYITLDGLQIELLSGASYKNAIHAGALPNSIAKNCLIKGNLVAGGQNTGVYGSLKLQCCAIFGFNTSNSRAVYTYGSAIYANNVTAYGCSMGFHADTLIVAKNCLTQSCGTGYAGTQYTGSSNNIKDDSGGSSAANATQLIVAFANAGTGDFHAPGNANIGIDLSASGVLTDIDGQTITTWYIGADAVPGEPSSGTAYTASSSESSSLSDDIAAVLQMAVTVVDSAGASDSQTSLSQMVAAFAESSGSSDTTSAQLSTSAVVQESAANTEVSSGQLAGTATISETATALDSRAASLIMVTSFSEAVAIASLENGLLIGVASVADTGIMASVCSVDDGTLLAAVEEALSVSDSSSSSQFEVALTAETSVTASIQASVLSGGASISESTTHADVLSSVAALVASFIQTNAVNSSESASHQMVAGQSESLSMSDVWTALTGSNAYTAEILEVLGSISDTTPQAIREEIDNNSELAAAVKLLTKVMLNKAVTDPTTGKFTVYDDDNTTVLVQGNLFEDAEGTIPYKGEGSEHRGRLT